MFVPIVNTPRDYAWGSAGEISRLLGREESGATEAELWLGAHEGSPARILDPQLTGGAETLDAWIAADAASAGLSEPRLPFLLKVLAAAAPLSLQAHPSPEQAVVGFERENAAGIPLGSPQRNYKDAFHKPELIVALSERFEALCGFRPVNAARADLAALAAAADPAGRAVIEAFALRLDRDEAIRDAVESLLGGDSDALIVAVTAAATVAPSTPGIETVRLLGEHYPGDAGVVTSLLINRVSLRRGEALFLPAGNIHAYLSGLGIELMAASDNVLRGGLTPKHIDVPELLDVLDFTPLPLPYLAPVAIAPGVEAFRPDVRDFELLHVTLADGASTTVALAEAAIVLAVAGSATLTGAGGALPIERGGAVYVSGESELTIGGDAELFIAQRNRG